MQNKLLKIDRVGSLLVLHYCCDATKIFTNDFGTDIRYNWKARTKKFPRRWPPNIKIQHKNGNFAFPICCVALWRYHNQRAFFKTRFPFKTYIQSLFWQRIRLSSWASFGIASWKSTLKQPNWESLDLYRQWGSSWNCLQPGKKYWENYIFKNIGVLNL